MSITARDLIKSSMRKIRVLAEGESPTSQQQVDAIATLNGMLGNWSLQELLVYQTVTEKFLLVASQGAYTIGTGANFDTNRPVRIDRAGIEDQFSTTAVEYPVRMLTLDEWASIRAKSVQSSYPAFMYIDDSFPLTTLQLWPIPTVANKLVLYSQKPLTAIAAPGDVLSLPPGYEQAMIFNLAVLLAPEYDTEPSQVVVTTADNSRADIKRANQRPRLLKIDPFLLANGKPSDWRTGE